MIIVAKCAIMIYHSEAVMYDELVLNTMNTVEQ